MLQVKQLTRKYKNGDVITRAVNNMSTSFTEGQLTFVLGASGSGKSTLLNVLCGLDTKIEGSVEVDGIDTKDFSKKEWAIYRNHYVGFVFQEYNLIEHLKLWENVALPLQFQGIRKAKAKKRAVEELQRIGLGSFVNKKPNEISGGQAQRVAIARALVTNPKVIMADEPTGALDTELGHKVISYLKEQAKGRVIVVVTHDEELALDYADRIIELEDGQIINDTIHTPTKQVDQKPIEFNRPKMTLGMMFKFARNNITSRMFRSIATSSVVSIGYIAIFLLSFLIFGINTTINDVINLFVPEDQYQIYPIENAEITEAQLQLLAGLDEIENIRYQVNESAYYDNREGQQSVSLQAVPYDTALLTQDAEVFGRFPEAPNEIMITVGMAGAIRGLDIVDEDSYEFVYNLVAGQTYDIYQLEYIDWEVEEELELGSYTIVGMLASQTLNFSPVAYMDYEQLLDVSELIHDEVVYRDIAIAYLSTSRQSEIDALTVELRDNQELVLDNFYNSITSEIDDFMFTVLRILVGVASITLIVSGILIGLIIYTSIVERIKEIGILTAIGARQGNIVGIFLFESGIIGVLSSLIAIVIALVLTQFINTIFNRFIAQPLSLLTSSELDLTLMVPKLWIIGAVIGFSFFYALLAGLIPSFQASRLNAVKALRRE